MACLLFYIPWFVDISNDQTILSFLLLFTIRFATCYFMRYVWPFGKLIEPEHNESTSICSLSCLVFTAFSYFLVSNWLTESLKHDICISLIFLWLTDWFLFGYQTNRFISQSRRKCVIRNEPVLFTFPINLTISPLSLLAALMLSNERIKVTLLIYTDELQHPIRSMWLLKKGWMRSC